jgi:hypothetical protein
MIEEIGFSSVLKPDRFRGLVALVGAARDSLQRKKNLPQEQAGVESSSP